VDTTNRNTALASALAEELARAGVRHACVSPGSRSAPLAIALWREPLIQVWTHVDERCGGFFALGIGQQTGNPAVVLTTSGTAGANLHPAVAEAAEARIPLIVITADRPPELRGRGAGQTIDQLKLYGSSARWFCELGVAQADDTGLLHYRSTAVRAVAESLGRPPGPVHLNVPLTEPLAPDPAPGDVTAANPLAIEGRPGGRPLTSVPPAAAEPSDELVAAFAELVSRSTRGLIVAGRQRDPELGETVAALARASGYPVLPEPTSQLRCGPHDRELVAPAYDLVFRDLPEALVPDLVIRVGDMVTSKPLRTWLGANPGCRQVVIDPDGAWNEPTATADLIARADPGALLSAFAEELAPPPGRQWQDAWLAASATAEAAVDSFLTELGDELCEPRVHRDLGALLPTGSTVFVASSMPIRDLESFLPSNDRTLRFLANRGANGIDGMVSSGLGAAAAGDGRTYLLTGDLGLYHDMNGLLAMRRLGVEATVIVLNNRGGAIFDFLPIARHRDGYEELFGTPTGLDLAKVADLYGTGFTRVRSYADLPGALVRPGLVEIPLDRARNVELHRELFERASAAARAAVEPA
jgi:2-succinyl-5-enolpyruvyl-6-hydroxy-3-cyclohexene-1-carboxylate synthase